MIYITMRVNKNDWESFKNVMLTTWFMSDNALLTRHTGQETPETETCTFQSEFEEDIDRAISLLPEGSFVYRRVCHV